MVVFRVIVGIICVSILVFGRGIWSQTAAVVPTNSVLVKPGAPLVGASTDESSLVDALSTPRLDLYGNPIEPAVGDYRTDQRGGLYERHAPDTAILEPSPPGV